MRLVRNLPEQLVIAHRPYLMGILTAGFAAIFLISSITMLAAGELQGLIFLAPVALSGLFFFLLVRPVRVIFDAPSNSVEIIKTTLVSRTRVTHKLSDVSQARLVLKRLQKGGTQTQIQLVLSKGESKGWHPITDHKGGPNHARIGKRINTWLKQHRG